jgi:ribosome-associated heat shock protein Hsp15
MAEKVRIDKWLWAVRIFKSRTISTDFVKSGKVKVAGNEVKPSFLVGVDQTVVVKKEGFNFEFQVLKLLEKRVGAPIAVTCYQDITSEEEKNKYAAWFLAASGRNELRERGAGRPTKRDRREIDWFKDGEDGDENDFEESEKNED